MNGDTVEKILEGRIGDTLPYQTAVTFFVNYIQGNHNEQVKTLDSIAKLDPIDMLGFTCSIGAIVKEFTKQLVCHDYVKQEEMDAWCRMYLSSIDKKGEST